MGGSSVHFDRSFMARHMPTFLSYLHHRHADTSVIYELAKKWRPDLVATAPRGTGKHLAMDDILDSIAMMKHYRDNLFLHDTNSK